MSTETNQAIASLLFITVGACCISVVIWLNVASLHLYRELQRWRRLVTLYLEKRIKQPLPVDAPTEATADSEIHLPDDLMAELEARRDEEA